MNAPEPKLELPVDGKIKALARIDTTAFAIGEESGVSMFDIEKDMFSDILHTEKPLTSLLHHQKMMVTGDDNSITFWDKRTRKKIRTLIKRNG